jgi:acyl carrier protein
VDPLPALRAYVVDELLVGEPPAGFDDRAPLLGAIDSLGVLRLVAFVEKRFGARIPDREIVPGTFESLERLASTVRGLLARG